VFLVGGFGRSQYLYKRVEEYCKDRGFGVRRPPFPWSAVVRGAVARGLEPNGGGLVELRKCRLHYGTPISERFIPGEHSESDSYIDELTGVKYAKSKTRQLFFIELFLTHDCRSNEMALSKRRRLACHSTETGGN
jgi:hypothetical protein